MKIIDTLYVQHSLEEKVNKVYVVSYICSWLANCQLEKHGCQGIQCNHCTYNSNLSRRIASLAMPSATQDLTSMDLV